METTNQIAEKKESELISEPDKVEQPAVLEQPKPKISPLLWVSSTNFAEGLPYMIVRILSTVYFTDIGVKERFLGYLNFLVIPWNLKFLWSPFIDIVSTKRRWLVIMQFFIGLLIMAVAVTSYMIPAEGDASRYLVFIAVIFVGMAFLAATNDIAIDGYYLEGLTDKRDQAAYSGYRVVAFRLAMIFARSGLVAVAAIAASRFGGANKYLPWVYAFGAGALTMFLLSFVHGFSLPHFEQERRSRPPAREVLRGFGRAFYSYLQQDRIALMLIFIGTYKMADEIIFSMVTPFLMRELGITKAQYSWIAGIVGAAGTIIGAMLGAWWIKQHGLKKAIWPLTILMNFNIWAYIWLAYAKPNPTTSLGIAAIAFVHGYEQVAAGLGGAALTVYLMRTCKPDFKAAHYAVGTAIMVLPSAFIGGFGGQIVEHFGYLNLFIIGFFASIPSMLLLFWVPIKEEEKLKLKEAGT